MNEAEMRANVIRLAFDGEEQKFDDFCHVIRQSVPEAQAAVLRGSSVTGLRHRDKKPFDADGPGTSDLDLTLIGGEVFRYYDFDGYFVPGAHSRPLSDADPDIAPELVPLRQRLIAMTGRPVNIQASREWVQYLRGDLLGQPYLKLFGELFAS